MNYKRTNKIVEQMKRRGIDQLLVCSPSSIFYLTGQWIHPGERFLALLICADGSSTCIANKLFYLGDGIDCPTAIYSDEDDPIALLMKHMADKGKIGIDSALSAGFLLRIIDKLSNAKLEIASECVELVRMVKDSDEIESLRSSSHINDLSMGDIINAISPELSEIQLAHRLPEIYCSHGGNGYKADPIVSYGANCADPHHGPDESMLKKGDSIVIDTGIPHLSYYSDMTRTVFYADVSPELERIYHVVLKAQLAAEETVAPGVKASDVDAAARRIITEAGYGQYFTHRTGHNIGIDVHEAPSISSDNSMQLVEGMCFSIEPGIYIPGVGGVRIEDLVVVSHDACEVLNKFPKDLRVIS